MIDLRLSDVYVGILIELYWNGSQQSRSTPRLRERIDYLIDAGLIEEFQQDRVWWGKLWFIRITEQGVNVLKQEIDPLRVFDLFLTTIGSIVGACVWVMTFDLAQLPEAFVHPDGLIREAAEVRLMEIENRIELSDDELLQMMQCYRAVVERHRGWIPSRAERRLTLLGLLSATVITPPSFSQQEVDYALNLTDKGTRFLEEHCPITLVKFLISCMAPLGRGPDSPMLRDSYHMNRLLKLFSVIPAAQLVELLVSENELIRNHAVQRLESLL